MKNDPTLTDIRVIAARSEETPCFTAKLTYRGIDYVVSNEGHGGANSYHPFLSAEIEKELDDWAAANNPPCQIEDIALPMNFETWTFERAFACVS